MGARDKAVLVRVLGSMAGIVWGAQALAQGAGTLWAEATVSDDDPYVQESVVYTVRIYSPGNLQTVELTPPVPRGASLEEIDRGTASSQVIRGRRMVVNEYHYLLTPLAPGTLEVPPTRMNVQASAEPGMAGMPTWGARRTPLTTNAVRLTPVALPDGAGLPLRFLDVKAHWGQEGSRGVGEPLTLTVVTKGLGVIGDRLPSVAPQLRGKGFKVYPERPQVDWKWGSGGAGAELWGRRVETFTVVPTEEGALEFPAIDVAWWDVLNRREAHARIPGRILPVGSAALARYAADGGEAGPRLLSRLLTREALTGFVLPVGVGLALAFVLGWWLGLGGLARGRSPRGPGGTDPAGAQAPPVAAAPAVRRPRRPIGERLAGLRKRLPLERLPVERLKALRDHLRQELVRAGDAAARVLPLRVKVWWCVRCAVRETQPEALCRLLRRFACEHLQMSPNVPLATIVDRIQQERPGAGPIALDRVFQELEAAAYAGRALDLRAWKREFRRRFQRAFVARQQARAERRRRGLPELNP